MFKTADIKELKHAPKKKNKIWGTWVAHLVGHLTSAQVMISWLVSSSPVLGSVLTAQSLGPTLDSVSHSLSASPPTCALSLSLSLQNKHLKNEKKRNKVCYVYITQCYLAI